MPASYTVDTALGVVFSRRWGVLTDREVTEQTLALGRDPRFHPTLRQLVDLRDVVRFDVTADAVQQRAAISPFACGVRRAAIVRAGVSFGLLRMYQSALRGSPEDMLLCQSMAEALDWLGLDPSTPWPSGPPDHVVDGADPSG